MGYRSEIIGRLKDQEVNETTLQLVRAALLGPEAVERVLSGASVDLRAEPEDTDPSPAPSAYLQSITVTGFRGIGPEATLQLDAQPGLTLVVGRNGSGKSSFFDALEVLLTDDSYRWKGKTTVWKSGWRNFHRPIGAQVSARFRVKGVVGETLIERRWADDAKVATDATTTAHHHGRKLSDLEGIGWIEPLELYRPLLSHPELGTIATKPSGLYDALSKVLGLEEMSDAIQNLSKARTERERLERDVQTRLDKTIIPTLQATDDFRATAALESLSGKAWQLDKLDHLLTGGGIPSMQELQTLSQLVLPTLDQVVAVASQVEKATVDLEALSGTDLQRASDTASLLQRAWDHHRHHGEEPCPVCGEGRLDAEWSISTKTRIGELERDASRYRVAQAKLDQEMQEAKRLVKPPTIPVNTPVDTGGLRDAWRIWATLPDNPSQIPQSLIDNYDTVAEAAGSVIQQARERHSAREAIWMPVRDLLLTWLPDAKRAGERQSTTQLIGEAETVLQEIADEMRSTRWEPIEEDALGIWRRLRLQSNIDLESITLAGKGTRRRVDLKVMAEGQEVPALSVASQGEINCLALSLFFPRGTLPESPFRFLVIDDPVQAMDPARVDGLARVFHHIAENRQLVVFTHDNRLPEALRRLSLPCSIKEVTRQPGSAVTVRNALDPVAQYFDDAWAVARDERLPAAVASQTVPGICRQGLEAACVERIRSTRIGRGEAHARVEQQISQANTFPQLAALALLEDTGKASQVGRVIADRWGQPFAEIFWACNKRAHEGFSGDLLSLINTSQGLAQRIKG